MAQNASLYTFGYDGLGDRVRQLANGVPITYALDQAAGLTQVLSETAGAATTRYLYGRGRIDQQTSAATDYFLGDALGSVRALANSNGNVTLVKSYDPYGQTLSSSGTGRSNYDFTGEYKDSYIKLLYLRARYLSLDTARFITKDSILGSHIALANPAVSYNTSGMGQAPSSVGPVDYTRPQSLNAWSYADENPINNTDPSGHWYCQSGLVPFGDNCLSWVQSGLARLASSGAVGKKLSDFYYQRDRNLTIIGAVGGLVCPAIAQFVPGIKVYFEQLITTRINANAFALGPDQIHFNSSRPGYSGATPSDEAVVTFGHEISHLAQGAQEFSIQGEVLSTIIGFYLEDDLNVPHRPDAQYIVDNKINPWNQSDLAKYNNSVPGQLPWPLVLGNGLPRDWLGLWGISLPFARPPVSSSGGR